MVVEFWKAVAVELLQFSLASFQKACIVTFLACKVQTITRVDLRELLCKITSVPSHRKFTRHQKLP